MRCCRVVGPMWASVKHPAYAGKTLFVVQPLDQDGKDVGHSFVAIDNLPEPRLSLSSRSSITVNG